WHICATLTEPVILQKCGSAKGMSTEFSLTECLICLQSVATIFVAVGKPVLDLNSAIISLPEKLPSAPQGSSTYVKIPCISLQTSTASSTAHAPFGSKVILASGNSSFKAFIALISSLGSRTPPFSLKSLNPYLL